MAWVRWRGAKSRKSACHARQSLWMPLWCLEATLVLQSKACTRHRATHGQSIPLKVAWPATGCSQRQKCIFLSLICHSHTGISSHHACRNLRPVYYIRFGFLGEHHLSRQRGKERALAKLWHYGNTECAPYKPPMRYLLSVDSVINCVPVGACCHFQSFSRKSWQSYGTTVYEYRMYSTMQS